MSLLERLHANPLPFAQLLGVEYVGAAPDVIEARMVVRPDLCTLGGFAHGGAIMSFADTLGGAAAFIGLSDGAKGTTTLESKTNFVGAAPAGSTLVGRLHACPSRPPHPGLADAGRDRRRQADRAGDADPDDAVRRVSAGRLGPLFSACPATFHVYTITRVVVKMVVFS